MSETFTLHVEMCVASACAFQSAFRWRRREPTPDTPRARDARVLRLDLVRHFFQGDGVRRATVVALGQHDLSVANDHLAGEVPDPRVVVEATA